MTCFSEKHHKARKTHLCCACRQYIRQGEIYTRWRGIEDGTIYSSAYHVDCRLYEIELNKQTYYGAYEEWFALHEHISQGGIAVLDQAPSNVRARFIPNLMN